MIKAGRQHNDRRHAMRNAADLLGKTQAGQETGPTRMREFKGKAGNNQDSEGNKDGQVLHDPLLVKSLNGFLQF